MTPPDRRAPPAGGRLGRGGPALLAALVLGAPAWAAHPVPAAVAAASVLAQAGSAPGRGALASEPAQASASAPAVWPPALGSPQARPALTLSRLTEAWLLHGEDHPQRMLASLAALAELDRPPQGISSALWRRALLRSQAHVAARSGQVRTMQKALESLRQLDPQRQDALLRADQALVLALHEDLQGRSAEARDYALAAQADYAQACQSAATVAGCDPRAWWRSLRLLTLLASERGEHVQARRWAQSCVQLARTLHDERMEVRSLLSLAQAHAALREREQARQLLADAARVAQGSDVALARVYLLLGQVELERGRLPPPQQHLLLEQALELTRQQGAYRQEAQVRLVLSQFWIEQGQPDRALASAQLALGVAQRYRDQRQLARLLHIAGLARLALGQPQRARADLAEAQRLWGLMEASDIQAQALGEHSRMLERLGDTAGALRLYHQERMLLDQIERRNRDELLAQLREQYAVHAQQAELERLEREHQLIESQLENQTLKVRVAVLAAAVLMVAAVLVLLLVLRTRDINRRLRQDEALLRIQSERDALTGLANRHHVRELLAAQGRLHDFRGVILLIDVDHFKRINDQHGHAGGDTVLVEVARRLSATLRSGDLACRWGGEEFLILARLLPDDALEALVQRLMHAVSDTPVPLPGAEPQGLAVGLSVGYAAFPLPGAGVLGWERALRLVDAALYAAKRGGRGRAVGLMGLMPPGFARAAGAAPEPDFDPQRLAERAELRVWALQAAGPPASAG